jgi:hypothetical protein
MCDGFFYPHNHYNAGVYKWFDFLHDFKLNNKNIHEIKKLLKKLNRCVRLRNKHQKFFELGYDRGHNKVVIYLMELQQELRAYYDDRQRRQQQQQIREPGRFDRW